MSTYSERMRGLPDTGPPYFAVGLACLPHEQSFDVQSQVPMYKSMQLPRQA